MDPNVEGNEQTPRPDSVRPWVALEREAERAAKLAILRTTDADLLEHLGASVREHQRHAEELGRLVRTLGEDVDEELSSGTREAYRVGCLEVDGGVAEVLRQLEAERIERYASRARSSHVADALLERHLEDARARARRLDRHVARSARARNAAA